MKKHSLLFALLFVCLLALLSLPSIAQSIAPNQWTWLGGGSDDTSFGVLGTPSPNNMPSGRHGAATWADNNGNLWLFGGDITGFNPDPGNFYGRRDLNDLWKYTPSTNEWTWMGGSTYPTSVGVINPPGQPPAGSIPGARDNAITWTDHNGNLWLFGGEGFDDNGVLGLLNDLWQFTPATNQWVRVSGNSTLGSNCPSDGSIHCAVLAVYGTLGAFSSANTPGSRLGSSTWTDSQGHLWLFGGWGYGMSNPTQYYFNDLWEFDPSTKQWAWMGGSSTGEGSFCFIDPNLGYYNCGEPGIYGALGTAASGNNPGGRSQANSWIDSQGNLFLFGGKGFDAYGSISDLNDLWKFNPSTMQWTWINGSSTVYLDSVYQTGVSGTLGVPASENTPATRWNALNWTDKQGNFWIFGGRQTGILDDYSGDGSSKLSMLGDLWEYHPSTNQWAWMGGNNVELSEPTWVTGTIGTPAPGNTPGARYGASAWTDNVGNFWFFGGIFPIYPPHRFTYGNDLWAYQPSDDPLPTTALPIFIVPEGTYDGPQTVTISDATNGATIYYTTDGSTPTTTNSSVCTVCPPISIPYSKTLKAFAVASGSYNSAVATATYTLPPQAATPTFSVPAGTYTSTQTVTISDSMDGATIYYTTNGLTPTTSSTVYTGPITVSGSEMLQAIATADGHTASLVASAMYILNLPRAATPTFSVPGGVYPTPQTVTISDATPGTTIHYDTGGIPTANSPVYTGPITVSSSRGLSAIAMAKDYYSSDIAVAIYTIDPSLPQAAAPTFSVASGTYTATQTVTLNDSTSGVTIYYTTDGSTPARGTSMTSPGGSINVSQSETLKAIAVVNGYSDSAIVSASYTINLIPPDPSLPQAAAPTFSVASGTYTAAQMVTLNDSTPGVTIYYTTDGSMPARGTSMTSPGGSINVSQSETLKAIAVVNGYSDSTIVSSSYTINLIPPDFSIAASTSSLNVTAGQSTTAVITVAPLNGFNSAVSFACSGLATGSSCSFSPATVAPLSEAESTTLTVTTSKTSAELRRGFHSLYSESTLAVALCFLACKKRRRFQTLLAFTLSIASLTLLSGCASGTSSGGSSSTHQSATSIVTVTATAGSLQRTTTLSLTIN